MGNLRVDAKLFLPLDLLGFFLIVLERYRSSLLVWLVVRLLFPLLFLGLYFVVR